MAENDFLQSYAQSYDELFGFFKKYSREANFIHQVIFNHFNSYVSILDLACGTGSHIIELSKIGHNCSGLDVNQAILAEAQHKALQQNTSVNWIHADMRNFVVAARFSVIINMFYSFQNALYTQQEQDECLHSIYNALDSGGLFIMEILPEENNLRQFPVGKVNIISQGSDATGAVTVVRSSCRIVSDNIKELEFIYETTDLRGTVTQDRFVSPIRRMFIEPTRQLLQDHQFKILHEFGDYDLANKFGADSTKLIFIAQKR